MGYYIDQLAEQDRQRRLADLLMAGEAGSFPAFMPKPDYRDARDLGAMSTGGGLPPEGYDFGPPAMMDAPPSDTLPSQQFRGESVASRPQRPFLRDLVQPQPAPLPQNYIRNERTGAVTDLGQSQPQRPVGDFGQVAVDTPFGRGRYMKGDNTRVALDSGTIVDLGRDTGRERAIEKENLDLQKQRAELARLQGKPVDPEISKQSSLMRMYNSIPEGPMKQAFGEKHGFAKKNDGKQQTAIGAKKNVSTILNDMSLAYEQLKEGGATISPDQDAMDNLTARAATSGIGQLIGGAVGTKNQSVIDELSNMRPILMQQIAQATGMSSKQMDSNKELQFYLQAATDPTKGLPANLAAIKRLDKMFGLGSLQSNDSNLNNQNQTETGKRVVREVKLKDGRTGVEYSDGTRGFK